MLTAPHPSLNTGSRCRVPKIPRAVANVKGSVSAHQFVTLTCTDDFSFADGQRSIMLECLPNSTWSTDVPENGCQAYGNEGYAAPLMSGTVLGDEIGWYGFLFFLALPVVGFFVWLAMDIVRKKRLREAVKQQEKALTAALVAMCRRSGDLSMETTIKNDEQDYPPLLCSDIKMSVKRKKVPLRRCPSNAQLDQLQHNGGCTGASKNLCSEKHRKRIIRSDLNLNVVKLGTQNYL